MLRPLAIFFAILGGLSGVIGLIVLYHAAPEYRGAGWDLPALLWALILLGDGLMLFFLGTLGVEVAEAAADGRQTQRMLLDIERGLNQQVQALGLLSEMQPLRDRLTLEHGEEVAQRAIAHLIAARIAKRNLPEARAIAQAVEEVDLLHRRGRQR